MKFIDHNLMVTSNQFSVQNRSACAAPYVVGFYFATSRLSRGQRSHLSVQILLLFPTAFSLR